MAPVWRGVSSNTLWSLLRTSRNWYRRAVRHETRNDGVRDGDPPAHVALVAASMTYAPHAHPQVMPRGVAARHARADRIGGD